MLRRVRRENGVYGSDLWGFLRDHPTLTGSAVLFTFYVARLLAISGYSQTLALAILRQASPIDAAIGLLLEIAGLVAAILLSVLAASLILRPRLRTAWRTRTAIIAGVIAFFLSPLVQLLIYIGFVLLFEVSEWMSGKTRNDHSGRQKIHPQVLRPRPPQQKRALYMIAAVTAIMALTSSNPWLPTERLDFYHNRNPLVGYVLSEDEDFLYVLSRGKYEGNEMAPARTYLRIKHDSIRARSLCEIEFPTWPGGTWARSPARALEFGISVRIAACPRLRTPQP